MGLLKGTDAKQPAKPAMQESGQKVDPSPDTNTAKPNFTVTDGINLGVGLGIAWTIVLPILLMIFGCIIWTILALVGVSTQSLIGY